MGMLAKVMVVIILQYRSVLTQHIAHLKLTQYYISMAGEKKAIPKWGNLQIVVINTAC